MGEWITSKRGSMFWSRFNAFYLGMLISDIIFGLDKPFTPFAVVIAIYCIYIHGTRYMMYDRIEKEEQNG